MSNIQGGSHSPDKNIIQIRKEVTPVVLRKEVIVAQKEALESHNNAKGNNN
jgi:hypothetical protein